MFAAGENRGDCAGPNTGGNTGSAAGDGAGGNTGDGASGSTTAGVRALPLWLAVSCSITVVPSGCTRWAGTVCTVP